MTTERIIVDGQPLDVEVKPLTLLLHQGGMRIDVPSRVEINPEDTLLAARTVTADEWARWRIGPGFVKLWAMVFTDREPPESLQGQPLDVLHVVGLIVRIAEVMVSGQQPFVRLPETYLHPRNQAGLGDMFAFLSNRGTNKGEQS